MKISNPIILLLILIFIIPFAGCKPPLTPEPNPEIIEKTPTPTLVSYNEAMPQEPVDKRSGILEIRFPDPWGGVEFCSNEIPYLLILSDGLYSLEGEGKFLCHQIMTYEEGMGIKQHLEQEYDVILSGSMSTVPNSILEMELTLKGYQDGYYSDLPEKVPETISVSNPFHVEIDQSLLLKFVYEDNAYCVWNQNGVFTNLPGDEPPVDQSGWLFLLHPKP